ncbi:MAG: hypothetical protein K0S79_2168, partial [Nitrospira sp.]|nr:hypothetical protein [Nitrospira sp.]
MTTSSTIPGKPTTTASPAAWQMTLGAQVET